MDSVWAAWPARGLVGRAVFVCMLLGMAVSGIVLGAVLSHWLHIHLDEGSSIASNPATALLGEGIQLAGIAGAAAICALVERRRSLLDYNLRGPYRLRHFFTGLVLGFGMLSALVGSLTAGGWLRFGAASLSGAEIARFALLWGAVFLTVALCEEGLVRCYLQFTLTRGVNYWWALGLVLAMSALALLNTRGSGAGGVYLMGALGILPCLWLQWNKVPSSGFWQAAWLTSTFFGYVHTFNKGETWIGIFSAAAIGFVFCVSVWKTGSAWWAIGFHAAWDWAQTFFYGTADSGFLPKGHLFATAPAGPPLWSGGSDGPEGSLLVVPTVLAVLLILLIFYRRREPVAG